MNVSSDMLMREAAIVFMENMNRDGMSHSPSGIVRAVVKDGPAPEDWPQAMRRVRIDRIEHPTLYQNRFMHDSAPRAGNK